MKEFNVTIYEVMTHQEDDNDEFCDYCGRDYKKALAAYDSSKMHAEMEQDGRNYKHLKKVGIEVRLQKNTFKVNTDMSDNEINEYVDQHMCDQFPEIIYSKICK